MRRRPAKTLPAELRALTSYANREIELWMDKRVHEARVSATSSTVIDGLSANVPAANEDVGKKFARFGSLPAFDTREARNNTGANRSGCRGEGRGQQCASSRQNNASE